MEYEDFLNGIELRDWTGEWKNYSFRSFGGLGDAFLIMLKISEFVKENSCKVNWTHIESNNIRNSFLEVYSNYFKSFGNVKFIHDPNYIQNIKKYTENKTIIPTPVRGKCNFYKKEWPLKNPFLDVAPKFKEYDIVLQVSGGANNDRMWAINPTRIAETLASMGRHVVLVGTNKEFKTPTKNPEQIINLVDRTSFCDVLDIISKSNLFIGLSGVLNYFSCAAKVENIHVVESEEHERIYYHPNWLKYTHGIHLGTLHDIVKMVNFIEKARV